MATIFLSYRRTDSPQACRVYDWLTRRFGNDAVFMDVADIPFATRFTDYIRQEIAGSSILVALIGDGWREKLARVEDPVLMEIETAVANNVPVLPVLIGTTPMPNAETLPPSIRNIAYQNAHTLGVSRDFDTHMQALVPKVEAILGSLSRESVVTADPNVIRTAFQGISEYLREWSLEAFVEVPEWRVIGTSEIDTIGTYYRPVGTLFLHRVAELAEVLELHFILSFWASEVQVTQHLAGQLLSQLKRHPVIPERYFAAGEAPPPWTLKIRSSDEDPRQIWKAVTDQPLRLSLAYIATVSPKPAGQTPAESQ